MKNIFKKFRNITSFSILVVPGSGASGKSPLQLKSGKLIAGLVVYSLLIFLFSILLLSYTPVGDLFFTQSNLSRRDRAQINELREKMIFLSKELEGLKSTNERLRYAIMLGDSSALKEYEDSSRKMKDKTGGNLLAVIEDLFFSENTNTRPQDGKIKKEPLYYFYSPANGYISRRFNPDKGHFGQDFVLKSGTPVYAAAGGYVVFADYTVKDGYMLIINHPYNYITVYKHCSVLIKKQREIIFQGDLVALSGNTGEESAGPHLHFEIWKDGKPVDPDKLLLNNKEND